MNFNLESARDTPCKNILIYGYCKYENKGCVFSHQKGQTQKPPSSNSTSATTASNSTASTVSAASTQFSTPQASVVGSSAMGQGSESKRKFNFNTPSFQPSVANTSVSNLSNKFATLSPKVADIPVFVPAGLHESDAGDTGVKKFNASTPSFKPLNLYVNDENDPSQIPQQVLVLQLQPQQQLQLQLQLQLLQQQLQAMLLTAHLLQNPSPMQQRQTFLAPMGPGTPPIHSQKPMGNASASVNPYLQSSLGTPLAPPTANQDMYFSLAHSHHNVGSYPLAYHLYAPAPPPRLTIPLPPHETNANNLFIANELRESLHRKNEATLQTLSHSNLPSHVEVYHSLVPIDKTYNLQSSTWGIPASTYKVFSQIDGNPYVLRKIDHNFAITNETPFKTINKWKALRNSNVVKLYDAFTTMVFGDEASLVLVYDYYPEAKTLTEVHSKKGTYSNEPITEELLWLYIVQIANALQGIHEKLLVARSSLDLSKIIVTSKNRLRLSACGVDDVMKYEQDARGIMSLNLATYVAGLRIEDIKAFGLVILQLAALLLQPSQRHGDANQVFEVVKVSCGFSEQLLQLIAVLLNPAMNHVTTIGQIIEQFLAVKMIKYINDVQDQRDFMESQLASELENARLFRLISKLNFIIDRPEFEGENPITSNGTSNGGGNGPLNHSSSSLPGGNGGNSSSGLGNGEGNQEYAKNGSKYILKLFRDYVFMQYDDVGKPVVDLSRVLTIMNKLDAGIDERFVLVSRDQKSCIIVSFKEIRDLLDSIFRQLTRG